MNHKRGISRLLSFSPIFLVLSFWSVSVFGGSHPSPAAYSMIFFGSDSMFRVGEELTYNVSYASIDIGQVRIKLQEKSEVNGKTQYKAIAYIDSYKGVPLVDLHAIYEDSFDGSVYSTWFRSRNKQDEQWISYAYHYNYPYHAMYIEKSVWGTQTIDERDTLKLDTLYQDGLSLFYLARTMVMTKQKVSIPTVVNEKKGTTFIDFTTERTSEEIDAVDYDVDVIHFTGEAGFVGIFGLTGGFEGWFSNDAARVPILAKMKVIIGSVRLELMRWKRDGWSPPRYQGND
jgi:hypothetical protein